MKAQISFPKTQVDFYPMTGGLDLVSPAITLDPGKLIDAQNYEAAPVAGYRRINGFERSDGRASPTAAGYWVISVTSVTGTLPVDATVTGLTSAATGKVLGLYGAVLVIGRVTGTFNASEALQVAGTTRAFSASVASANGAPLPADDSDYRLLSANDVRRDILVVPGSGTVRGGFTFNDICHAFRDNAGATAGDLYKQTAGGWVKVPFGTEIQFTGAIAQVFDGNTITGLTSAATGTVVRAMLRSGTWASAGVGTLVINVTSGVFASGEALQVGGATKVTSASLATTITRLVGGRIESVPANFTGSTATKRIYGADGVNPAFEFDGTNYIPIRTGSVSDTPLHICYHRNHLFLTFLGDLQFSGIGAPYSYTILTGANAIGMGDVITNLVPQTGNTSGASLAVFTSDKTSILYGSGAASFQIIPSVYDIGTAGYTAQAVSNNTYGMTGRGIQSLITTLNYGDFNYDALSFYVQPLLALKRGLQTCSVSLKAKNQYRLFFNDSTAVAVGLTGEQISGIMPLNYGIPVRTMWSSTLSTGVEMTYFSSDDGYVYLDNTGTSFDGAAIEAWIRPAFNNLKSPRIRKQYRRAIFEVSTEGYCKVNATYEIGYGSSDVAAAAVQADQTMVGVGGYWGQFTWDQFVWDSPVVQNAQISIDGTETNISFLFYSNRAQDASHTVQGVTLLFTPRRLVQSGS